MKSFALYSMYVGVITVLILCVLVIINPPTESDLEEVLHDDTTTELIQSVSEDSLDSYVASESVSEDELILAENMYSPVADYHAEEEVTVPEIEVCENTEYEQPEQVVETYINISTDTPDTEIDYEYEEGASEVICGSDASRELDSMHVSDSGTYERHFGKDTVRVFAIDRSDALAIGVDTYQTYDAFFNVSDFKELELTVGLEDGDYYQSTYVSFYLDESESAVTEIELKPGSAPKQVSLDLDDTSSLKIEVYNGGSKVVLFDISITK